MNTLIQLEVEGDLMGLAADPTAFVMGEIVDTLTAELPKKLTQETLHGKSLRFTVEIVHELSDIST